jgi:hypothetical protein
LFRIKFIFTSALTCFLSPKERTFNKVAAEVTRLKSARKWTLLWDGMGLLTSSPAFGCAPACFPSRINRTEPPSATLRRALLTGSSVFIIQNFNLKFKIAD